MTVASRRARGMSGMATEWPFQLDHGAPYCDNVGVVCNRCPLPSPAGCSHLAPFRSVNPVTLVGGNPVSRMADFFRSRQVRYGGSTRGAS